MIYVYFRRKVVFPANLRNLCLISLRFYNRSGFIFRKKGALRGGRPGFPFNMPKRKRGYSYSTEKEYTVQKSYGSPAWKMLVGNDGMLQEFG